MVLSICVYLGSRPGDAPAFADAARALGTMIGRRAARLVYGGGKAGLMGLLADAALAAGATVVGVMPESLMKREVGHRGLTELHVVQTMHERKQMMAERADAFIALPGGIGTMEEMFEVWSWQQLGYHDKPVALLNVDRYYDPLIEFLAVAHRRGLVSKAQHQALLVDDDLPRLFDRVAAAALKATGADDYSQI
jgi:uncharacterized protein (TIGR00730 family)